MLELSTTCAFKEHPATCRVITAQRPLADLTNQVYPFSKSLRLQYNAQLNIDKHSRVTNCATLADLNHIECVDSESERAYQCNPCANRPAQSPRSHSQQLIGKSPA